MSAAAPRALILDQWGHVGGAQRVMLETLALWRAWGWQAEAAFPLGGAAEQALREEFGDSVTLHDLRLPPLSDGRKSPRDLWTLWRSGRALLWPAVAETADIVHVNGPRLYHAWRRANRRFRRPTVYHVHLHHHALERIFLTQSVGRDPCGVLVSTSLEVDRGLRALGARPHLVVNAMPQAVAQLPWVSRWPAAPLRWAVVAAMGEHKGQDIAVEAARALPQTELYLVGPTLPEHREWAAALRARVSANVQVLGEIDDVPGWLARTGIQVMVLPSRRPESLSMAMLESLASSCIVLLSERARMESAGTQLGLRRFADADGLVASLRGMLESPDAAAAESAAQHATLHRVFGPARYAEGIAAAYADARVRAGRERDRRRGQPPR